MLLVALALLAGQAGGVAGPADPVPFQILKSPAFDRFADATDAACPMRRLRSVTPGDFDLIEQNYVAKQPRRVRKRLATADDGDATCLGRDGLACPATATLDAIAATGQADRFAAFACTWKRPR